MPTMKFSQRIIRGIFFSIPLLGAAIFAFADPQENLASLYFASQPDYRVFLEDFAKLGQGKADTENMFSRQSTDSSWFQHATSTVSQILADRRNKDEYWTPQRIRDVSQYIVLMCHRHEFSPYFLVSLIEVESEFRPDAVSAKGAIGLMQLKMDTAQSVGLRTTANRSLHDPKTNIRLGVAYLLELRSQFGDPNLVMAAYNIGPTATWKKIKAGERVPTAYAEKIRRAMIRFAAQRGPVKRSGVKVWL